jgi:hypothetical protein
VREAEETPLLEAVAMKWLVKTAGWERLVVNKLNSPIHTLSTVTPKQ